MVDRMETMVSIAGMLTVFIMIWLAGIGSGLCEVARAIGDLAVNVNELGKRK